MLSKPQITAMAKKYKINESVILREYIQLLVLNKIFSFAKSSAIFFKGGTCLHLIYKAPRFSEDLDFTVCTNEADFLEFIQKPFGGLVKENTFLIREKKSLAGKTYLLTYNNDLVGIPVFVRLDFSFLEQVLDPQKAILTTEFPVLIDNYINCFSQNEILAEKIRAILTRDKGRDYYDLWYLLSQGATFNQEFIQEKLNYYGLKLPEAFASLKKKVVSVSEKDFIIDLRPFIPVDQREKLPEFLGYIKDYISQVLALQG